MKPWNYSNIKLSISVISTQKGLKTKLYGTDKEEDIYVGFPKHWILQSYTVANPWRVRVSRLWSNFTELPVLSYMYIFFFLSNEIFNNHLYYFGEAWTYLAWILFYSPLSVLCFTFMLFSSTMFALRALDPLCTHEFLDVCASCINCLIVVFAAYIRCFFFLNGGGWRWLCPRIFFIGIDRTTCCLKGICICIFFLESRLAGDFVKKSIHK